MQKITDDESQSRLGLVISYFGNSVSVETDGEVFHCYLRRNQELPIVGDRVRWLPDKETQSNTEAGEATGTIIEILPRTSLLARGDRHGKMKPIAANVDHIVIVMSPPPIFTEYLIDRYLIAAELLAIPPILVVNKMDLLKDDSYQSTIDRLAPYRAIPYPVIFTSVIANKGLEDLVKHCQNKTAVLVGPSGVGKSSIIGALGHDTIKVGHVTNKGIGRHTTTATRLYHLPHGGQLIDSPGVREFNLWSVSAAEILKGFKEFHEFLGNCKFRDCHHLVEPGCSVQAAVASGKISAARFANYQTLMKEASGR